RANIHMKKQQENDRKTRGRLMLALMMPIALFGYYWTSRPFQDRLVEKHLYISDLNTQQKMNIQLAASTLNATVIKPGEEFSFNRVVGPRTSMHGYLIAPSYLESDTPGTFGGGICVVSSLLYQDALESDMTITERVAHTRTMQTIA